MILSTFRHAALLFTAALLLVSAPALKATDSTLDAAFVTTISPGLTPNSYPTFDTGTGAVIAVALQSDGKIVAGGNISRYKTPPSGSPQTSLKRLNSDGTLDTLTSFNTSAATLSDSQGQTVISALLTIAGDKLYVGGVFTSYQGTPRSGLLRLNADGTLDTTFNTSGISNSNALGIRSVFALAEQPSDGKLLVGGVFNRVDGINRPNLARFNADGSLDTSFNPITALATSGSVGDIEVLPNGQILVGTDLSIGNFTSRPALLRLNSDGSLDSSFNVPFLNQNGSVQQVLPLPDGRIVITGFLAFSGLDPDGASFFIAAVQSDGSLDTTFVSNLGSGPNGWTGGELILQPDGTILAGGIFNEWNGQPRASIARLNQDGTLDPDFAVPPYEANRNNYGTHLYSFAVQPDGKIVAGGWFSRVSSPTTETFNITRIVNEFSATSPGTLRLLSTSVSTAENASSVTLQVSRFGGLTGAVSVNFATANGTAIAGSDYTTTGGNLSWAAGEGGFKTITVPILQDTAVEGSESFTVTLSGATGGAVIAPAQSQATVTLRDDDSAPVITSSPTSVSLEQGAKFTLSVRYDSVLPTTVQWQRDPDGAGPLPFADIALATGTNYTVTVADPAFHAGDYRALVTNLPNGTPANATSGVAIVSISVPTGSVVTTFAPADIGSIIAAAPDSTGRILALTSAGLRRLSADGVVEPTTSFGISATNATSVLALADGRILVGGSFTSQTHQPSSSATSISRLVRLNADATGTVDSGFAPTLNGPITTLAAGASGKFYAGVSSASTATNGIQRFLSTGLPDATFAPAANTIAAGSGSTVYAIQEQPDGKVLISHRHAGTYRLSRLTATGALDPTFGTGGNIDLGTGNWITGLDVLPDGRIAVSARFNTDLFTPGQRYLAILNADGSLDPSFWSGAGVFGGPFPSGVIHRDGRLLVYGSFTTINSTPLGNLVRFNLDGSVDNTFSIGSGASGSFGYAINSAFYIPSGDLFIGGSFTFFKGVSRNRAALLVGNPQIGAIGFAPPRVTALDQAGTVLLTLRRYGPSTEAASITYTTADTTATAGADYTAANGTVSWAAGDSADKTIALTILGDTAIESTETFRVLLSDPSGPVGPASSAIVELLDANTPATFTTQPTAPVSAPTVGGTLTLSAAATSPTPTTYQWFLNGVALTGATATTYTRTPLTLADAGLYTVVATNASGPTTSTIVQAIIQPQAGRVASGQTTTGRPLFNANPSTILPLPDGGALVGGSFTNVNSSGVSYLVRVTSTGALDPSFNLQFNLTVNKLLRQPDGKIIVAGVFGTVSGTNVASLTRLNADLTLDTAFSTAIGNRYLNSGVQGQAINDIALDAEGRIYVGTTLFSSAVLQRLSSAGVLDATYTPALNQVVRALAIQPDGKLIVTGFFTSLAGSPASRGGRLNSDGTRDATFAPNLNSSTVNSISLLRDGRILVAGGLSSASIIYLNADGSLNATLATGNQVYKISQSPVSPVFTVARTSASGSGSLFQFKGSNPFPAPASSDNDLSFNVGTGPNAEVLALAHNPDGSIWITGSFTTFNGFASGNVVKLQGTAGDPAIVNPPVNVAVPPGTTARFTVGAVGTGLSYQWFKGVTALTDDAHISGTTTAVLSLSAASVADEDAYSVVVSGGSPVIDLPSAEVRLYILGTPLIATQPVAPATRLFLGETFSLSAEVYAAAPASYAWRRDGQLLSDDARTSGTTTASLAITGVLASDTGTYTLTITNAQGTATTAPAFVLVTPAPDSRAATHLGLAANHPVSTFLPLPDGRMLIGGSGFTSFTGGTGSTATFGAFALVNPDGSLSPVGSPALNLNDTSLLINAIIRLPNGKYMVGGTFTTLGGLTRNRLARLNTDFSVDTTFDPGAGANGTVNTLAIDSSGRIYVGGVFSSYGGVAETTNGPARNRLIRLNADGSFDDTFLTKLNNSVTKLTLLPDGTLLVGGSFTANAGATPPIPASYLVRLGADGVPLPTFVPNVGSTLNDLAFSPTGDRIYVALPFAPYLRSFLLNGSLDPAFNPSAFVQNAVRRLAVQPDGKILAVGTFTGPSNTAPYHIVRLLPTGTNDPTFTLGNTNLNVGLTTDALALDAAGRVWLGGGFSRIVQGTTATRLLVLAGDLPELALDLQPFTRTVELGDSTTFTASARATGAVTWQWFRNGEPLSNGARISGTTTAALTITGLLRTEAGTYTATVSRADASVPPLTTAPAALTLLAEPEILVALTSSTLEAGLPFSFASAARGAGTLNYQWLRGGDPLPGQTSATLNLLSPAATDTGWYQLRVTNPLSTVTSAPALLTFAQYAGGLASGLTLPSFNLGTVNVVLPLANGAFLAGGSFTTYTPPGGGSTTLRTFAPITAAGILDPAYARINNSGTPTVTDIVRDSQSRTVFAGNFNTLLYGSNVPRFVIARLAADGSIDTAWNSPFANVFNPIAALAIDASDRVLVGGSFTAIGSLPNTARLARLSATTGAVDATFVPPSLPGNVNTLRILSDGRILVGTTSGVRLLEANGSLATGFTSGTSMSVITIQPLPNGDHLLGTTNGLQRITATGALVSPFPATGSGTSAAVRSILPLASGDYLLGGDFTTYAGVTANRITAIHADGTPATGFSFGDGFNDSVFSLALDASARIWAGGSFTTYKGAPIKRIAVLNTTGFTPDAPPPPATPFQTYLAAANVPEGQRGHTDDPEGDGIPNLLEYALGLNPLVSDPDGLPVPETIGANLTLTYYALRADLIYQVETTTTLGNPASWTATGVTQGTPAGDGLVTATVPYTSGTRFLRLRVTVRP